MPRLTDWMKAEYRQKAVDVAWGINGSTGYPDTENVLRDAARIAAFVTGEPVLVTPRVTTMRAGKTVLGSATRARPRK